MSCAEYKVPLLVGALVIFFFIGWSVGFESSGKLIFKSLVQFINVQVAYLGVEMFL